MRHVNRRLAPIATARIRAITESRDSEPAPVRTKASSASFMSRAGTRHYSDQAIRHLDREVPSRIQHSLTYKPPSFQRCRASQASPSQVPESSSAQATCARGKGRTEHWSEALQARCDCPAASAGLRVSQLFSAHIWATSIVWLSVASELCVVRRALACALDGCPRDLPSSRCIGGPEHARQHCASLYVVLYAFMVVRSRTGDPTSATGLQTFGLRTVIAECAAVRMHNSESSPPKLHI